MQLSEEQYLAHYGILRRSGRYPWGSGTTQSKRNKMFLDIVADHEKNDGMTVPEIAKAYGMSSTKLRALKSIALAEQRQQKINQIVRMQDKGMGNSAIARELNMNESSVRALSDRAAREKEDILETTSNMLRNQVEEKGAIDVGTSVERDLPIGDNPNARIGISHTKFQTAVARLEEEGYRVHYVPVLQLGTGNKTTNKVLAKPDVKWKDLVDDPARIKSITAKSDDHGRTYNDLPPLTSISSKRVKVRYAEEGGTDADGVVYVRRGAKDLDMGAAQYAQVRIPVDGTHYIKGMAVYKDDMPDGVDLVFNTNKSNTGNKLDALKPMATKKDGSIDFEHPFGAVIKAGGRRGHLNIVNEEGDWEKWTKSLPSQMLSKQRPELIKRQLDATHERRRMELDRIKGLTNPTVRKKLLESFADDADSASVGLKAAHMPGQTTKVILPIKSMKPHEVHAPNLENGTRVALVRFPHGGTFEIPQLTVNNKNREARKILGNAAKDAIGIHHTVAERLSGADFDGDHVLLIPNNRKDIKSSDPLEGLKGFDPKRAYPAYEGMKPINPKHMQRQMGDVSNLITDMTIRGASTSEIARAVRHSMVIIDSEKHNLDHKSSYRDNGIAALKERYQGRNKDGSLKGASTLISRTTSEARVPVRKPRPAADGGPVDRATGKKVFVETGETYTKNGKVIPKLEKVKRGALTDDAHTLSSGTPQEKLYADHANRLKGLANEARKEAVHTPPLKRNPSAAKVYAKEVASLKASLNVAEKNAPRERQAQAIANSIVRQKQKDRPDMSKSDLKKIRNQALADARIRTQAKKDRVPISQEEWNAIQAGAISNKMLEDIMKHADLDRIRELATPHPKILMSPNNVARAKGMIDAGFTQAEVAAALGVSLTTLKTGLE